MKTERPAPSSVREQCRLQVRPREVANSARCYAISLGMRGGRRRASADRPHAAAFPLCGPRVPPSCGAVFFRQPAREGKAAASYKRDAAGGAAGWAELTRRAQEWRAYRRCAVRMMGER